MNKPMIISCGLTEPIPRVIRFVNTTSKDDLVAFLVMETNLLVVNKSLYDQLDKQGQDNVLKTRETYTYVTQKES